MRPQSLPTPLNVALSRALRKFTASAFNVMLIEGVTYPADSLTLTVLVFFVYSYGTDLLFGRCPGMMLAGSAWRGNPTWRQKLTYCVSYTLSFALLFVSPLSAGAIALTQAAAVLTTGKTTHGWLANMDSAPMASTLS